MTDATKNPENVIPRRRASDWKKPPTVMKSDAFGWREGDGVAFLDHQAYARVGAALSGAHALVAILMQQDIDRSDTDGRDNALTLDGRTTLGLFEALASCIELAELHATGGKALWTTTAHADNAEAEHLRHAARDATISSGNRQAVEHVEQLNRSKAFRAAKKGGAA